MLRSQFFIPTLREIPVGTEAVSHQLLLRAGLVHMLTSGVYSYLPLGLRVLTRITQIIREEMGRAGAQELMLPCLHPLDLWQKTGRDQVLDEVMIKFEDKRGRTMCLGPTHEEVITDLVKDYVHSYRQLPLNFYQIQTKFRDEIRTRFGIVRACEFIMKDAYSFDKDKEGLQKNYDAMFEAYKRIFERCGLKAVIVEADSGAMGGDLSHEFLVIAPIGEDTILICSGCGHKIAGDITAKDHSSCPQCGKATLSPHVAIELGHIFQLGTKYSEALGAYFGDENGHKQLMIMGCYGIGVSRLIAAIIEKNNDAKGIIWPPEVAPFDLEILPLNNQDAKVMEISRKLYAAFRNSGWDVLLDDRNESAGIKFNDADLVGIPLRVIIGQRMLVQENLEIKDRRSGKIWTVPLNEAEKRVSELLNESGILHARRPKNKN